MIRLKLLTAVLMVLGAACAAGSEAAPVVAATPQSTVPTAVATTTMVEATTTTSTAPTSTTAGRRVWSSGAFSVAFTVVRPDGTTLRKDNETNDLYYLFHAQGGNAYVIFTTRGPSTLDEWRAVEETRPITMSEAASVEVGGLTASFLEFTVEEAHPAPGEIQFTFEPEDTGRVYVVEVNGEPVTIIVVAGPELWPTFEAEAAEVLNGLTWG